MIHDEPDGSATVTIELSPDSYARLESVIERIQARAPRCCDELTLLDRIFRLGLELAEHLEHQED